MASMLRAGVALAVLPCVALTAAPVMARPPAKHARPKLDPRDARINALEAQVKALAETVAELRAAQQQTVATQQQQAAQQEEIAAAQKKQATEVTAVREAMTKPKTGPAVNVTLAAGKPLLATG